MIYSILLRGGFCIGPDELYGAGRRESIQIQVKDLRLGFHPLTPSGKHRGKQLISTKTHPSQFVPTCDDLDVELRDRIERLLAYRNGAETQ
jgi:hypothetical protein